MCPRNISGAKLHLWDELRNEHRKCSTALTGSELRVVSVKPLRLSVVAGTEVGVVLIKRRLIKRVRVDGLRRPAGSGLTNDLF